MPLLCSQNDDVAQATWLRNARSNKAQEKAESPRFTLLSTLKFVLLR